MLRSLVFGVCTLLFTAAPAWGLRATEHLDPLETVLASRADTLAGATDKIGKKQLKAAQKSLARIAVDTASLAEDLKLAKKIAGPVAKAYATDDEVMGLLTAAADAFEDTVDARADVLARARAPLPEAKLTKKADRLLRKAEKARDKARGQSKLKKRLALLYKAQRSADKAADVLADALGAPTPTRLALSPKTALLTQPGETVTLRAVVLDQLERPMQATVSFASTNPDAAMVTGDGLVSAGSVGSAQILASVGDLETSVMIVNARLAEGTVLVGDARVASLPEPVDYDAPYGPGFLYTVELFGTPPLVGDLLVGTGEIPLGGLVVDVVGADPARVTLELRPVGELFAELFFDERIEAGPENLAVPAEVLDYYHVEPGEGGAYVFVPRDDAPPLEATPRRQPRGGTPPEPATTKFEVGPFKCEAGVSVPVGLNSPPTLSVNPTATVEFSNDGGLRLVATRGAIVSFSYKPRINAAFQGKLTCKLQALEMQVNAPGPLAFLVGAQVPIGVGFELSGTITFAQFGFDASWQDSFSVTAGIDCTSGTCEQVTEAPQPAVPTTPIQPFTWVLPNVLSDFSLALEASIFGYLEVQVGNPLWGVLRLSMLEAKVGAKLTGSFAPRISQLSNATSASNYKATLFAKVGAGVSIQEAIGFLSINVGILEVKEELDVANSPTAATGGGLTFDGPVEMGDEVVARVTLKDTTFLGIANVEEVRFYRKDGTSTDLKATVSGSDGTTVGEGLIEYTGTWTATFFDLGAEFGVMVKTIIPIVEFEIEANSLRTLEEVTDWQLDVTFPDEVAAGEPAALVIRVDDPDTGPVAGAAIEILAIGGSVEAASGTTDASGAFTTTALIGAGSDTLTLAISAAEFPGGPPRATAVAEAVSEDAVLVGILGRDLSVLAEGSDGSSDEDALTVAQPDPGGTFSLSADAPNATTSLTSNLVPAGGGFQHTVSGAGVAVGDGSVPFSSSNTGVGVAVPMPYTVTVSASSNATSPCHGEVGLVLQAQTFGNIVATFGCTLDATGSCQGGSGTLQPGEIYVATTFLTVMPNGSPGCEDGVGGESLDASYEFVLTIAP